MSGSSSGYSTFRLARRTAITVDLAVDSPLLSVRGDGRAVGVVVNRLGSGPDAALGVFVGNSCFTRGCERTDASFSGEMVVGYPAAYQEDGTDLITLPAGRYNATLVTDGAPVTAKLKLSGLSGSLSPTDSRVKLYSLSNGPPESVSPNTFVTASLSAPLPADQLISVGGYVISTSPLTSTERMQLAVQLPQRAG